MLNIIQMQRERDATTQRTLTSFRVRQNGRESFRIPRKRTDICLYEENSYLLKSSVLDKSPAMSQ